MVVKWDENLEPAAINFIQLSTGDQDVTLGVINASNAPVKLRPGTKIENCSDGN